MIMRQGVYSNVYHLVEVAGCHHSAPSAIRKRWDKYFHASMHSLVDVDAISNRLSDVYTLELTEFNATNAWIQNFNNGNQNNNNKTNSNYVRAVRK